MLGFRLATSQCFISGCFRHLPVYSDDSKYVVDPPECSLNARPANLGHRRASKYVRELIPTTTAVDFFSTSLGAQTPAGFSMRRRSR